ncbi:MAG: uroporphyrinogen-III C-methyltransferase [Phycisphaerae bacterium]
MSNGRVYLVGAGPGDPGLLTLRGRDCLSRADVVVYDHLVSPRLLDLAPQRAERIYAGKQAADHTLSQDEINALLVERARAGATVVRLKGGDPFVFGRGGEEALALADAGVEFEVVPGVTAAVAAAAYAGIPVTHRGLASAVAFVTGHEAEEKGGSAIDWEALARWKGTLVFYMGVENLAKICRKLTDHGLAPDTPAAAIRWGTTPRQDVLTATVATLPQRAASADLKPPAVILVGEVVRLRERAAWFEKRPLFGRRIVVTRPRHQAAELSARLEEMGARVIEAPVIRIEPADPAPLRQAVEEVGSFDWIVLTSTNGVEAFFRALAEAGLDTRALSANRIAVIGSATAERLARFGVQADLEPCVFTAEALVEALAARENLKGARILCPRADIAPEKLAEDLRARGARVTALAAYRTVADNSAAGEVAEMLARDEIDWLTFTSSSTVRSFFEAVAPETVRRSRVRTASIGPTTSATLRELGLEPAVEAEPHTIAGLAETIATYERASQT